MSGGRPVSRRVAALTASLAAGDTDALEAFWNAAAATGTPLLEPAGDDGDELLTFLWRDDGDTRNVLVVGGPARWVDLLDDAMERLEGSDVWFRTYRASPGLYGRYWLSVNDSLEHPDDVTDWVARERTFRADPLNPRRLPWPANPADPDEPAHDCSLLGLEVPAPPSPRDGVVEHRLRSAALGNERRVWLRVPPGDGPCDVLVVLDGWVWAQALPVAPLFARLGDDPDVGRVALVLVESLDDATRVRELECNPTFVSFLVDDVLPFARGQAELSADPARTTIAGQSLGGLASAFAALERPDVFGNVLSQSGSFWYERDSAGSERAELVTRRYETTERLPVRFALEVGLLEGDEMLGVNRHFRDVIARRGYDLSYREYPGGHDWTCWHRSLPLLYRDLAVRRARDGAGSTSDVRTPR